MWYSVTASLVLVVVASLYVFCKKRYSYFEKHGIKSITPLPFVGSMWRSLIGKIHMMDDMINAYNAFPDQKYFGIFEGATPALIIRDIEIIKKVTIKDFDHFIDHRNMFIGDTNDDSVASKALIFLKGHKWREMRGTLSPAFTGAKMRMMIPFMNEISQQVVEYLKGETKECENGRLTEPIETYDLFTRFANDVIASCAFGLKVDSLKDKTNEFYNLGILLTNLKMFKFLFNILMPRLSKFLGIKVFPSKSTDFFRDVVSGTMKQREDKKIVRHDMIHLLMQAKKGALHHTQNDDSAGFATVQESDIKTTKREWTDNELAAQAFIFYLAGFNAASTILTFLIHELALHPNVQEKLRTEVDAANTKNSELSYEVIQDMKYMDMVMSEILRKWAAGVILDRECAKDYTFDPPCPGSKPYTMKKNEHLYIYVSAMHMDEKYYPNPKKFDPERFSDEMKDTIQPFSYLPFGAGPRNCIGSRFALMEMKVILYFLIRNFEIIACEKTSNPIRLENTLRLAIANGSWVQFKSRQ